MQLFFNPNATPQSTFDIEGQEHIHLTRVLRKVVGDVLSVTDGKGNLYEAKLLSSSKRTSTLQTLNLVRSVEPKATLTLVVAPTKNISRFEWMIEKSVELGVKRIIPFVSAHSERKIVKQDRLQTIAISAMKQSTQLHAPEIANLVDYKVALENCKGFTRKYIAYVEEKTNSITATDVNDENICILIGPEGGFSASEVEEAKKLGFESISLGQNRLRTETAGIFAAAWYYAKT